MRAKLGASQPPLAKFLVANLRTIRCWEQGMRPIPTIAARDLDDLQESPDLWLRRVQVAKR